MSQTAEALSAQALQLPPDERLALVEHLLDSLDVPDASLEALWTAEANDRLAAYRRGEIRAIPLSDVLAKYQVANRSA
ncbi:MAG: addiction module protein [Polaromonas sp.]|nr:addiction module protein [Polaromonas sp.]